MGYEKANNYLWCFGSGLDIAMVAFFAVYLDADLVLLCIVMILDVAFLFFIEVVISISCGWIKKYEKGLFGSFALRDIGVLKDVIKTAFVSDFVACIPLLESASAEMCRGLLALY